MGGEPVMERGRMTGGKMPCGVKAVLSTNALLLMLDRSLCAETVEGRLATRCSNDMPPPGKCPGRTCTHISGICRTAASNWSH